MTKEQSNIPILRVKLDFDKQIKQLKKRREIEARFRRKSIESSHSSHITGLFNTQVQMCSTGIKVQSGIKQPFKRSQGGGGTQYKQRRSIIKNTWLEN